MEMKHAGSTSELLEFFINQPESALPFYLSPLDLAQMSLSCRWLHKTVQSNRLFVRNCLLKFLGPCMTAIRIFHYSFLGLETVDDYLYVLDDSITRNEVLKQFVYSIKTGKVLDEELFSQMPANWIKAISSKFQCDDNVVNATPFEDFAQFYEELGLNGQFDENELLCLDCEDQLILVSDSLQSSVQKPYKSKQFRYFSEFALEYGFALIVQLESQLDLNRIQGYSKVLGPVYSGSLRDLLLLRIELTSCCREIISVAKLLIQEDYVESEQCHQMLVDKVVSMILDNTQELNSSIDTFTASENSDDGSDNEFLGLNEDACELFRFIPYQLFCKSVLPAFEKLLPSKPCASMLAQIVSEYGMFSDGQNALYRMIARKVSSDSPLDQSIVKNVVERIAWCRNWKNFHIVPISQSLCDDVDATRENCKQIVSGLLSDEELNSDIHLGITTAMSLFVDILGEKQRESLSECIKYLADLYFCAFWDDSEYSFLQLDNQEDVPYIDRFHLLVRGIQPDEITICKVVQYLLDDLMKYADLRTIAIKDFVDQICASQDDYRLCHPKFPSMLLKHLQSVEYPEIEILAIKLLKLYGSHGISTYFYLQFVDQLANLNLVTDLINAEMQRLGEKNVDRVKAED
ncbi:hypothetical protein MP228_001123 [Amoeboaphelidium protococcarum]|nr:hypothetical protein MP228_001123 [Amoeboaphelidium protococcarum]